MLRSSVLLCNYYPPYGIVFDATIIATGSCAKIVVEAD